MGSYNPPWLKMALLGTASLQRHRCSNLYFQSHAGLLPRPQNVHLLLLCTTALIFRIIFFLSCCNNKSPVCPLRFPSLVHLGLIWGWQSGWKVGQERNKIWPQKEESTNDLKISSVRSWKPAEYQYVKNVPVSLGSSAQASPEKCSLLLNSSSATNGPLSRVHATDITAHLFTGTFVTIEGLNYEGYKKAGGVWWSTLAHHNKGFFKGWESSQHSHLKRWQITSNTYFQ